VSGSKSYAKDAWRFRQINIYPNSEYHESEMVIKPTPVLRYLLEFNKLFSEDLIIGGCDIFVGLLLLYLEITWRGE
jgi:hypothetical protein